MYNSNNIAERIKLFAKSKGISMKQLLIDVNLGKNTMTNFKTSMPKADNLAKIADYLDCSIDYLMGRTDVPEINKKESNVINITPKAEFTGELAAFGGDFVSSKEAKKPEIL